MGPKIETLAEQLVPVISRWPGLTREQLIRRVNGKKSSVERALLKLVEAKILLHTKVTDPEHENCGKSGYFWSGKAPEK